MCTSRCLVFVLSILLVVGEFVDADGSDHFLQNEAIWSIPKRLWRPGVEEVFTEHSEKCLVLNNVLNIPDEAESSGRQALIRFDGHRLEVLGNCDRVSYLPSNLPLMSSSDAKTINSSNLHGNGTNSGKSLKDIPAKVWISSIVAIVVISGVGLLGVAIVPLMQKVFYNHVIQFLVALAVGTLTGDAMLHLLPHAISAGSGDHGSHDEAEEKQGIFKGLVALGGLYFFFIAEKLVAIFSEHRAEKKAEEEQRKRAAKASRKPSTLHDWKTEEDQRRRPSRCDGAVTVGLSSHAMKSIDTIQRYRESEVMDSCSDEANTDENAVESTRLTQRHDRSGQVESRSENGGSQDPNRLSVRITLPEREVNYDHLEVEKQPIERNHGHGHSHEVPDSIASVAWMVILGDGLHNFTDGLAIGAAFGKSFTLGLSTAVAVFFHELPHELGDFAVLLTTGMSVKQALFYNILSSFLCLIGMFIGIALRNVESASFWIFAMTAGIFIYIALVDMLPELSSIDAKAGESRLAHFVIQNLGIMTGVGIMLLIAVFEDKIKSAFG